MADQGDIDRALRGKEVWNAWAEENPGAQVDFAGVELALEDFKGFVFPGKVDFSGSIVQAHMSFRGTRFRGTANFDDTNFRKSVDLYDAKFIGGQARFHGTHFWGIVDFCDAKFRGIADFSGAKFHHEVTMSEAEFFGIAQFERTKFMGRAAFRNAKFHGLVSFNDADFKAITVFEHTTFESVPTFHDAHLHGATTFEGVIWPEHSHQRQNPYDAVRAWARLRVEMNRLQRHEDELIFFAKELESRARDTSNEPWAKRMLYCIYLRLGAGRSAANPMCWLVGLSVGLFQIYRFAIWAIQGHKPLSWNTVADVVSFTVSQALPLVAGSNPERADLYRRLFAPGDCGGIDVPLWMELVGTLQQVAGVILIFLIGVALRNRFRMK